jgi:hypothetical protein
VETMTGSPCSGPLAEALRTIALRLDVRPTRRAQLIVSAAGVTVDATAPEAHYSYTWQVLVEHSRAQQRLRGTRGGTAPWRDPAALTRWSVLLRLIGSLLDAQGVQACIIAAAVALPAEPNGIEVSVIVDGRLVVSAPDVHLYRLRLLLRQIGPRQASAQQPAARRPPRWQLWHRAS